MQWKARAIKGAVMGGDSQDKAGNFKAGERPRKMDISVALPLRQHTLAHAKKFREKEGNWTPVLMVLAFLATLVILLPEYRSGIAN